MINRYVSYLFLGFGILFLWSCEKQQEKTISDWSQLVDKATLDSTYLKYATSFQVYRDRDFTLVRIPKLESYNISEQFYLFTRTPEKFTNLSNEVQIIKTPVKRMVSSSTTHLPSIVYLDELNSLVGFPNPSYVYSSEVRDRIENGDIRNLGSEVELNLEIFMQVDPEVFVTYSYQGESEQQKRIKQMGYPVLYNLDFTENHPLGRAEWIKFMALLFEKSEEADSIFNQIEQKYNDIRLKVKQEDFTPPTVMSGVLYGDTWYMPGGRNHMSILIQDAGGEYVWQNDSTSGSLKLSFEDVYSRCNTSDIWLGVADFSSLESLKNEDSRYSDFRAFENGNVYNYTLRTTEQGGNDYFETGYLRPDLVLKDMASIFNSSLYSDYKSYFYKKLE